MAIFSRDKFWLEILSWISGKQFKKIDIAFEWLGKEAEKFGIDPHRYHELVDLIMKCSGVYNGEHSLGSGLFEIKRTYTSLKESSLEFQEQIRMILVGLQIRATGQAVAYGREKGLAKLTVAVTARLLEQTLFGDSLLPEPSWKEIISSLQPGRE